MLHEQTLQTILRPGFGPEAYKDDRPTGMRPAAVRFHFAQAGADALAAFASAALVQSLLPPDSLVDLRLKLFKALLYAAIFVLAQYALEGYSVFSGLLPVQQSERTIKAATLAMLLDLYCLVGGHQPATLVCMFITAAATVALVTARQLSRGRRLKSMDRSRAASLRVMMYGNTASARRIYDLLARSPQLGLAPGPIIDPATLAPARLYAGLNRHRQPVASIASTVAPGIQVLSGPIDPEFLLRHRADLILIDPAVCSDADIDSVRRAAVSTGTSVGFLPGQHGWNSGRGHYMECDGVLLALPIDHPGSLFYEMAKRLFDLIVGSLAGALLAPVILLAALAVKFDSEGPAFFVQTRIGKHGRAFPIFKLRTMHSRMCGEARSPRTPADPRITRVGRWLRRTGIDELPQLVNVLRGEMSLVGPRPEMPMIVDQYTPAERKRLAVTPGITGVWQISADRRFPIHERMEYDLYYIEHRSLFLDMAVILHTVVFAIRSLKTQLQPEPSSR